MTKPAATKPAEPPTKPEPDYRDEVIAGLKARIVQLESRVSSETAVNPAEHEARIRQM